MSLSDQTQLPRVSESWLRRTDHLRFRLSSLTSFKAPKTRPWVWKSFFHFFHTHPTSCRSTPRTSLIHVPLQCIKGCIMPSQPYTSQVRQISPHLLGHSLLRRQCNTTSKTLTSMSQTARETVENTRQQLLEYDEFCYSVLAQYG